MSTPLILTAVVAAVVVAAIAWGNRNAETSTAATGEHQYDSEIQQRIAEEVKARPAPASDASDWVYVDETDPMTDQLARMACTGSTNQAALNPPYRDVAVRLCLRQSPRLGTDAYIALVGDGQIICRSYSDCAVKVRFDDGATQSFSANRSADGSSNIVFIANPSRFIGALKGTDLTRVELLFYEAGSQAITFPTANLVWPRPTNAAKG